MQARERCFFGKAPTLSQLQASYGKGMASAWLVPQLFNLSEFCGCKDKITTEQLRELAGILTTQYYFLKVTEWMLFFYQFKCGKYGKFYGAVDPMTIISAVPNFLQERARAIEVRESVMRAQERAQWAQNCVTREEYLRMIKDKQNER